MLWFFAVGTAIGAALWVAVRIEPGPKPGRRYQRLNLDHHDHSWVATRYAAAPGSGQRLARTAAMPALGDDARGLAFLELSTHPGREQGAFHLQDLVLEPDEGLILRLSEEGEGTS
jgi:hypothetical protein